MPFPPLRFIDRFLLFLSILILIHPAFGQNDEKSEPATKEDTQEIRDVDFFNDLFFDLGRVDIPLGSVVVYLDNGDPQNDSDKTVLSTDGRFSFDPLASPSDYSVDYKEGILRLKRPLRAEHTLALYFPGIDGATLTIGEEKNKFRLIGRESQLRNRYKLRQNNILTDRDFSFSVIDSQSGLAVDRETHPAFYDFRLENREGILIFAQPQPFRSSDHDPYGDPPQTRYRIRIGYRYSLSPLPEEYETFTLRPEVRDLPLDASLRFKGEQNISLASGFAAFVQSRPTSRPPVQIAEPFDLRQSLQLGIEGKALSDQLSIDIEYSNKEDQDILLTQPDRITLQYNGNEQPTDFADLKLDLSAGNKVTTDLSEKTELDINDREVLGIMAGLRATKIGIGDLALLHRVEVKGIASRSGGTAATDEWVGGRGVEEERITDLNYLKATYYDLGVKDIPPGSERVFIDDRNATSDTPNTLTSDDGLYNFDLQFTPRDYTLDYRNGIIRFDRSLSLSSVIAISYEGMPAPPNQTIINSQTFNVIKPEGEDGPELKNRYNLKRRNIIHREGDDDFIFEIIDSGTGQVVIRDQVPKKLDKLYDFSIDYDEGILTFTDTDPFDTDVDGITFAQKDKANAYSTPPQERYLIRIRYKYDQEFRLGHINIIEGSERVLIGQGFAIRQLIRDEDYSIFYQIGRINFREHIENSFTDTTRITVNYAYAPFVGGEESTLLGTRLEIEPIAGLEVGGSYYRNFADATRNPPAIGGEPPALQVWDLNAGFDLARIISPPLADEGVEPTPASPSTKPPAVPWRLTLDGEVAGSIREPNTFDVPAAGEFSVSIIDDMEGTKSSTNVPLIGRGWLKSSAPIGSEGETVGGISTQNIEERPFGGLVDDLIKTLVLSYGPGPRGGSWVGIRRSISPVGADYTDYVQLEIVIRSDRWDRINDLHIDLGQINEDTPINGLYNGNLNSEDVNRDGVLNTDEDTGIDNIPNGGSGDDPEDNFDEETNTIGTEGNRFLDTEDMDGDGTLESAQGYLEYILPLNLDRLRSLAAGSRGQILLEEEELGNGWKRITLPLRLDDLFNPLGSGELEEGGITFARAMGVLPSDYRRFRVKHVRIWTEAEIPGVVNIESIRLLRNEWRVLDPGSLTPPDLFEVGSISHIEEPATYDYTSPFYFNPDDPKKEEERALVISYELAEGVEASAVRNFGGPLPLLTYQDIRFSINLRSAESETLGERLFLRLGGDEDNYVQYNTILNKPGLWQNKVLVLQDIQEGLKSYYESDGLADRWGDLAVDGFDYRIVGQPSLEDVKVFFIGVTGGRVGGGGSGRRSIWINDLRASGGSQSRIEETGIAWRAGLGLGYQDIFSLKANVRRAESGFRSIGDSLGPIRAGPDKMNYQADLTYDQLKFLPFSVSTSGERNKKDTESKVNPAIVAALDDDKISYNQGANIGFNLSGLPDGKEITQTVGDLRLILSGDYLTDESYTSGGGLDPDWYESWNIKREGSGGVKRKTDFNFSAIPRLVYRFPQEIVSVPMGRENEWEVKYTHTKKWTRFTEESKSNPKTVADLEKLSGKDLEPDNTFLKDLLDIREPVEIVQEFLTGWKFQPIRGISLNPVNVYTYGRIWEDAIQDEIRANLNIRVGDIESIEKNLPWLAPRLLYSGSNLLHYQENSLRVKGSPEVAIELRGRKPKDVDFLAEIAPWSVELPIVRLNGNANYKNVDLAAPPGRVVNRLGWVDDDAEKLANTFDRIVDLGTRWKWTLVKEWKFSHFLNYSEQELKPKEDAQNEHVFATTVENGTKSDQWTFAYNYGWMQEVREYNPLTQAHTPLVEFRFNLYKPISDQTSVRGTYREVDEQTGNLLSRSIEVGPRLELYFPISAPAFWETPEWDWWIFDGRKLKLDQTIDINPSLSLNYSWQEEVDKNKKSGVIKKNGLTATNETQLLYDFTKNFKGSLGSKLIGFVDFLSPFENYYAAEVAISVSIVF